MDIHIAQAISELMGDSGWLMRGLPTNETEFNSMFRKITGVDDNGVSIESDDPADFGITWDQVVAKQAEMQTAEDNKTANKASAVSKLEALGLTADEISALTGS